MDASLIAQFGPYGGIIGVLVLLVTKWLAHNKVAYRLKKIEEIVNKSSSPAEKQKEISERFKCWADDDRG